jgi:hypothetical protein
MRLVCFLTRTRERSRKTAPASICVLRLNQPITGGEHRRAINVTELGHPGGESHEDLPGIEGDRDDRCLIHHSTLEPAAW